MALKCIPVLIGENILGYFHHVRSIKYTAIYYIGYFHFTKITWLYSNKYYVGDPPSTFLKMSFLSFLYTEMIIYTGVHACCLQLPNLLHSSLPRIHAPLLLCQLCDQDSMKLKIHLTVPSFFSIPSYIER